MKLSELRPCDNCGNKLAPAPYRLHLTQGLFNAVSVNTNLGMMYMLGDSLTLAEVMSPNSEVLEFFGDKNKDLEDEILLCQDCVMTKDISLALLIERVNQREKSKNG